MNQKNNPRPNTPSGTKPGTGKTAPPSRPATSRPAMSGGRPQGEQQRSGVNRGQQTAPQRPQRRTPTTRQAPTPTTGGFGSRDVTLLIGGVMVVIFVVIGALIFGSRNSNTPSPNAATETGTPNSAITDQGTPNVILEPSVAAGLTAAASNPNPKVIAAQTALASHTNITPVPVGQVAPDFTLPANDGKTYTLSSFRGKSPVFMEFMAPWCPHCQNDSVMFNQVYDDYVGKGKNLQMLGVSAHPYGRDYEDKNGDLNTSTPISMDDLNWFRDTFNVKYPLLLDPLVKQADVYGIEYFPTLYILDKDGKVSVKITSEAGNPITVERIEAELDKVVQ